MLTGRTPFSAPTPQAMLAAQVTKKPEPVTAHREAIPPALAALVMRCLAKHPADRFQWAGAVLEALEQMVTTSGGITPTGSAPYDAVAAAAAARAHPLRVAGLFALTSVAVLGVVYFLMNQLGLPSWVMPWAVGLLVVGLPIMVTTGLIERRRALARTTGRATALSTRGLRGWLTWRKALGGGVAAFAALGLGAGGYTAMRVLVTLRENAKDDGAIIEAVDRLSGRLRERIGESLRTIRASEPLAQVTTGSLEALQKYSQALRVNDAGETDRAVALLGEAIALDTTFAMAYRKLAVVLNNTGQAPSRIADAATNAFRHRDRLTPLERNLAAAFYYYQADFDRAKVESGYRSALELDPENYMALNNLALALNTQRKFTQAESLTQRGVAVSPTQATLYVNAMQAQIGQGN